MRRIDFLACSELWVVYGDGRRATADARIIVGVVEVAGLRLSG
jgi:hypothetical protein